MHVRASPRCYLGVVPVLRSTAVLMARLASGDEVSYSERAAYVHVARRHGTFDDAQAWLAAFLDAPNSRGWLLSVVHQHGTAATAAQLYDACVIDRGGPRLAKGVSSHALRALGYLGFEPAIPALWAHATAPETDYTGMNDAYLGLLDLPCENLGRVIAAELTKYEGTNNFPELLPCLAVKTGNPLWLHRLLRWGRDDASTDCNGGIILGIAMFGAPAREPLLEILNDLRWEAHASATGSRRWARLATRVQQVPMRELYARALAALPGRGRQHAMLMVSALLELWFEPMDLRAAPEPVETARDLLALLFQWSTPHADDSLIARARDAFGGAGDEALQSTLYEIERSLHDRVRHDLEVDQLLALVGSRSG